MSGRRTPAAGPASAPGGGGRRLEAAIGHAVRRHRRSLDLTVADLAERAGRSRGMLSKIENGVAAPSLGTLAALAGALRLPVTAFFRHVEAARDAIFAPAGQGLALRGRGSRAGPRYRLLGHAPGRRIAVEPYMITLRPSADLFPPFQHAGVEFLYMLEGELGYRHGERIYRMRPGDALSFDADVPHGPVALTRLPIRFLSVICYASDGGDSGGLSPPGANARLTRSRIRPGA